VTRLYTGRVAAGEALFSLQEARLLRRYGGLRKNRDVLLFDPVHCYGLTEFARIVDDFVGAGWPAQAFWPHGGHLFSLHVVAALGLGGAELNPFAFHPFNGTIDGARVENGMVAVPQVPDIGFEPRGEVMQVFRRAFGDWLS